MNIFEIMKETGKLLDANRTEEQRKEMAERHKEFYAEVEKLSKAFDKITKDI